MILIPPLEVRKLRLRKTSWLPESHTWASDKGTCSTGPGVHSHSAPLHHSKTSLNLFKLPIYTNLLGKNVCGKKLCQILYPWQEYLNFCLANGLKGSRVCLWNTDKASLLRMLPWVPSYGPEIFPTDQPSPLYKQKPWLLFLTEGKAWVLKMSMISPGAPWLTRDTVSVQLVPSPNTYSSSPLATVPDWTGDSLPAPNPKGPPLLMCRAV